MLFKKWALNEGSQSRSNSRIKNEGTVILILLLELKALTPYNVRISKVHIYLYLTMSP